MDRREVRGTPSQQKASGAVSERRAAKEAQLAAAKAALREAELELAEVIAEEDIRSPLKKNKEFLSFFSGRRTHPQHLGRFLSLHPSAMLLGSALHQARGPHHHS